FVHPSTVAVSFVPFTVAVAVAVAVASLFASSRLCLRRRPSPLAVAPRRCALMSSPRGWSVGAGPFHEDEEKVSPLRLHLAVSFALPFDRRRRCFIVAAVVAFALRHLPCVAAFAPAFAVASADAVVFLVSSLFAFTTFTFALCRGFQFHLHAAPWIRTNAQMMLPDGVLAISG
ncbi:hypothetical protein ACHAWF_009653, partial [Thalassiosira exigua]